LIYARVILPKDEARWKDREKDHEKETAWLHGQIKILQKQADASASEREFLLKQVARMSANGRSTPIPRPRKSPDDSDRPVKKTPSDGN
jgi:hypothetical protein